MNLLKLEDVNKRAKAILDKHKTLIQQLKHKNSNSMDLSNHSDTASKHSHLTTQSKLETRMVEVQDQSDRVFILSLFTFHTDNLVTPEMILKNSKDIRIYIAISFKNPEFYLKLASVE